MKKAYITTWAVIAPVLILTVTLTLFGMRSLIDMWQHADSEHWLTPFLVTPVVGGVCAVVCYLFYTLLAEDKDEDVRMGANYYLSFPDEKPSVRH